jgi:predicted membrane-bound spermidine synthase
MFSFAWWLSLAVGFLSLSQEILWVRMVSFAYGTLPHAFSFVLMNYLIGIAIGAAFGKRLCERSTDLYRTAAFVLAVVAVTDALTPLIAAQVVDSDDFGFPLATAAAIIVGAGLKSLLFPIAHQLGSVATGPRIGRSVSRIYFGNIIGSTLGPLLTGYVLLDHFSVDDCFLMSALVCGAFAVASAVAAPRRLWVLPACLAAAVLAIVVLPARDTGVLQHLAHLDKGDSLHYFLAGKHGVVHTARAAQGGDIVLGGNIYDGRASVNVDENANRLDRLYVLGLVNPRPRRVLVIGMSTGAWTRALLGFPTIETIEVVEINPLYLELIEQYPEVAPVLRDPRVHIHIDDGRRWLKRHPDARFDLIVQNTTFHWRANSTNVLSQEYMTLVRRHLAPGGVVTMNTTGSYDVLATAQASFPHAYRYGNFTYASDSALIPDPARLLHIRRPDGRTFTPEDADLPGSVAAFLREPRFESASTVLSRAYTETGVITDDNLLTEYRHGKRFGPPFLVDLLPPPTRKFTLNSVH